MSDDPVRPIDEPEGNTFEAALSATARIQELERALDQAVALIRTWHCLGMRGEDAKISWGLYWNHAPEIQPIRAVMKKGGV